MMSVDSFGIWPSDSPAISERIVPATLNAIQKLLPITRDSHLFLPPIIGDCPRYSRRWTLYP